MNIEQLAENYTVEKNELNLAASKMKAAFIAGFECCMNETKSITAEMKNVSTEMDKCYDLVAKLAAWSRKYPRDRIYGYSKQTMDDELIQMEEEAKQLVPIS